MLHLICGWLEVVLVGRLQFHHRCMHGNAHASVKAHVVDVHNRVLLDDGAVFVDIRHMDDAKVRHCTVISEHSTAPLAPDKAHAAEAEAVVYAAVEPDMRSPVAAVPAVHAAFKTPVARR